MLHVRDARPADAEGIAALTNALLATTTYEWTDRPHTPQEMAERLVLSSVEDHPTVVAEVDGQVVGWAGYHDYSDLAVRPGYRPTVEHSVHVDQAHWGRGVGRLLVEALIERARADGRHVMVAAIDGENVDSFRFHQRLGFVEVGRLPEVGIKFGRPLDLVLMQRFVDH